MTRSAGMSGRSALRRHRAAARLFRSSRLEWGDEPAEGRQIERGARGTTSGFVDAHRDEPRDRHVARARRRPRTVSSPGSLIVVPLEPLPPGRLSTWRRERSTGRTVRCVFARRAGCRFSASPRYIVPAEAPRRRPVILAHPGELMTQSSAHRHARATGQRHVRALASVRGNNPNGADVEARLGRGASHGGPAPLGQVSSPLVAVHLDVS